jgi:hypothetical protein
MLDLQTKPTFLQSIETIQLLDEQTLSSGIQHLQIPQKSTARLKEFRIHTINELIHVTEDFIDRRPQSCGVPGLDFYWERIEREIKPRVLQFASSIRNGKVDWIAFWEEIQYEFTFAAARLDQIFQLDEETKAIQVNTLNFGKAVFFIEADGIHTVGDLVKRLAEGLPKYRGFGNNKTISLAKGLREFIATINSEGTRSSIADPAVPPIPSPKYRRPLQYTAKNRRIMSEKAAKLTLAQIHLHNEIEKLEKIGIQNLDQLLGLFAEGLPKIRGVGTKARKNLLKIAISADSAISESGEIDWDVFAEMAGFRTIPNPEVQLTTGTEFLSSLDGVVQKLTTQCFDEVESATLVDRLIPLKKNTVTLEELGRRFGVTRERIRQKQKKVIEIISAAVLENYYEGLSFRFTQHFSQFWRAAAEYFRGTDSVSYNEFIEGLTKVWNVERQRVIPHLPLIYAILTSNSTLPSEFNELGRLPPKIFDIKQPQDLAKPFTSLHPSKSLAKTIEKIGVNSIEQLLGALRINSSKLNRRTIDRLTSEILDPLSRTVTLKGGIAWQEFYKIKRIQCIPEIDSESPGLFVRHAIETVAEFIEHTEITGRSAGIFRLRTVPEAAERKTLDQAGKLLGCKGPSIKREENELLARLHDAILAEDYTAAGACFRTSFIKHWKKARKIYRQACKQDRFAALLSMEWELPVTDVTKITPMITCIIEGRPKGYTGKRYLEPKPTTDSRHRSSEATETPSVIRLRGFRTIH